MNRCIAVSLMLEVFLHSHCVILGSLPTRCIIGSYWHHEFFPWHGAQETTLVPKT